MNNIISITTILFIRLIFSFVLFVTISIYRFCKKKGAIYFFILITLMNLDIIFPALGGKITTTALIVGPATGLAIMLAYRHAKNASPDEYFFFASSGVFIGSYGLLKAWSAAAGTDVPLFTALLGKAVLGTLGNIIVGSATSVFGYGHYTPFPMVNPEGLMAQVTTLNPLLTISSLLVLMISTILWVNTSRLYGQWATRLTKGEKRKHRNRLISPGLVNSTAVGWRVNLFRQLANLFQRPKIPSNHVIVGMLPPVIKRPWALPLVLIGYLMIFARVRPEGTIFDPRPLIVVPSEGTLFIAGRGAGKTQTQIANLALNDCPTLSIETQGNVFSKELPINTANGRTTILLAPELGFASASLDYLAGLDPNAATFSADVAIRSAGIIDRFQRQYERDAVLVSVTLDLIEAVIGNVVALGAEQRIQPTLLHVYDVLTDNEALKGHLEDWTENGHQSYRRICNSLLQRLQDPEYVNGMEAIWGPQLRFLDDPTLARLVCAGTAQPFDPRCLLNDRNIDVVIQIEERLVESCGALLRLLLLGTIEPRMALNEAQARATPAPGLHIWIDELKALKGAKICDQIVVFGRQKGFTYTYCMQHLGQVADFWPEGTFKSWADSSDVLVFGKSNTPETTEFMKNIFGTTADKKESKVQNGDYGTRTRGTREEYLVDKEHIDAQANYRFYVWARPLGGTKSGVLKFVCDAPVHFRHPALDAFLERARDAFTGKSPADPGVYNFRRNGSWK